MMEKMTMTVGVVAISGLAILARLSAQSTPANTTITAVPGIKVGHFTLSERPTGCTVVLTEAGATAGVDVRGGAPGTRETDLLNPVNSVQQVHAVVLAGGSAFGLDAASGVVRYLDEKNVGLKVNSHGQVVNVPIVPAAILIDLGVGGSAKIRPTADCGYRAASVATTGPVKEGNVGAGAGATIGKIAGFKHAMKGGVGSAVVTMSDGLIVGAIVAVNSLGDVIDPATGRVVAGVRTEDGKHLADARLLLRSGRIERSQIGANSTIGVIATNASLTKTQATKIAQMAQDGYARAISPIHTPADGDTVFSLATGTNTIEIDITRMGALAAEVMAEAILRAVRQAASIPGYPAERDLEN
jgi:L-aminopeptidase/D-esterase-like protein